MKKDFTNQKCKKIKIVEKYNVHYIEIEKITFIECHSYVSIIHTDDNKKVTVSKLLKTFEEELSDFGFIRINRGVLVNLAKVKKYMCRGKRQIELTNGMKLSVSRRKAFLFKSI